MATFNENYINWMLLGLLVVGTIGFIVSLQTQNGLEITLLDDEIINSSYIDLSNTLSSSSTTANNTKTTFESDQPDKGFGALIIFAILNVGATFVGMIVSIYQILFILPATKLGIPEVVINVMSAILFATLVLMAWRLYRAGD